MNPVRRFAHFMPPCTSEILPSTLAGVKWGHRMCTTGGKIYGKQRLLSKRANSQICVNCWVKGQIWARDIRKLPGPAGHCPQVQNKVENCNFIISRVGIEGHQDNLLICLSSGPSNGNGASIKSRKHCKTKLLNTNPPVDGIKHCFPPLRLPSNGSTSSFHNIRMKGAGPNMWAKRALSEFLKAWSDQTNITRHSAQGILNGNSEWEALICVIV